MRAVEFIVSEPDAPAGRPPPAPAAVVDARGHRCPVPTLRLRRALAALEPGETVRLLADDPMAAIDVPHFAAGHDCRLLSVAREGAWMVFDLAKGR